LEVVFVVAVPEEGKFHLGPIEKVSLQVGPTEPFE
jgi:hypothetical protein